MDVPDGCPSFFGQAGRGLAGAISLAQLVSRSKGTQGTAVWAGMKLLVPQPGPSALGYTSVTCRSLKVRLATELGLTQKSLSFPAPSGPGPPLKQTP